MGCKPTYSFLCCWTWIWNDVRDFFIVSAVLCLCSIFLNTFWGVIAFDALDRKKWVNLAAVWVSHLAVSCLTLLNQTPSITTYAATVIPIILVTIATTIFSFFVAGGTKSSIISCFSSSRGLTSNVEVE